MQGYITSVTHFCGTHVDEIVSELICLYPQAEAAQIQSWHTLILDAQGTSAIHRLPANTTIAIEFSLPTDGMAIDLVIAG